MDFAQSHDLLGTMTFKDINAGGRSVWNYARWTKVKTYPPIQSPPWAACYDKTGFLHYSRPEEPGRSQVEDFVSP